MSRSVLRLQPLVCGGSRLSLAAGLRGAILRSRRAILASAAAASTPALAVAHLPAHLAASSLPAASFHTQRILAAGDVPVPVYEARPPPKQLAQNAYVKSFDEYKQMYNRSLSDPDGFWREMAENHVDWFEPFKSVHSGSATEARWFDGGKLNASYNCVDRHANSRPNKVAILWESDDGKTVRKITFAELHEQVQRAANALKSLGVKKGDQVCMYLPMTPEAAIAMLACARIGASHNVVFAGFSVESLRERVKGSNARVVITADELHRGGKVINLKDTVDAAVKDTGVEHVLVVRRGDGGSWNPQRDVSWTEALASASPDCAPEVMDSESPLFTLYTSGSTGKPKGLVHTTGGYLTYAAVTTKYAFDLHDEDVYFCTADIGWITGHTYIVYGPLALGATTLMFEGHPSHPHNGRLWEIAQKHKVTVLYTSPTAVRSIMRFGSEPVKAWDRSSIRIFGSVGEPIGPEAWEWLYKEAGDSRCPIIDTYWQTESGGILLSPLPGATTLKPGSATFPFFGVEPALLDPVSHKELPQNSGEETTGALVVKRSWPGIARTVLGDHERYKATYFPSKEQPEFYVTGDSARRDADGYWWIIGRMDDVVNVSGHRIGSAEVESAVASHPSAAEAAVVSMPHPIKGEAIFVYVTLKEGKKDGEQFVKEVKSLVAREIGKLAMPDHVLVVQHMPKTRSGKIMRRLLRKLVVGQTDAASLGDTSTLTDPAVVDVLKKQVADYLAAAK